MAHFGKYANLSRQGWTESTRTQVITVGQNAHIGLWGGGFSGEDLDVDVDDPTICVVHEEPFNPAYRHWRHFLITALRKGQTTITAAVASGGVWSTVTVHVVGHTGVRLVFFPGERTFVRNKANIWQGTIYVIGGGGESMTAAGGPPVGYNDRGGHTAEPTPPGHYVLGPRIHVTTASWPSSVIPWGAALRINGDNEVEYESAPGKWRLATGPKGDVVQAQNSFNQRDKKNVKFADVIADVRQRFIDSTTNQLWSTTWEQNDFGRWGWNLLLNGHGTPYYVHTTPDDENASAQGKAVFLSNSHGCIHLVPSERDRLMSAGYLKQGVPFEVRPYTEVGPP